MRRSPSPMDPNPADLLLTGGAVHTVSSGIAEAVAVRGGRITAVGSASDLATTAGATTRVVELEGRTILSGFQDAHVHPPHGGLLAIECNLHEAKTAEECLDAIARYAAEHPEREWIAGSGWSMDSFPGGTPDKESLDAIVPDRPVFVTNRDGHGAWVNSRALELASIDSSPADPPDGRIERGPGGEPSGTLHEGAMRAVQELVPATTAAEWEQAILNAQAQLHALGITAWQDATVLPHTLSAYRTLAERGELTMRAEGNLLWDRTRGEEQIDELLAMREQGSLGAYAAEERRSSRTACSRTPRERCGSRMWILTTAVSACTSRMSSRPSSLSSTATVFKSTCTRSAIAPCASRSTRSKRRGRRTAAATPATTWPTSSSSIPTTSPASPSSQSWRTRSPTGPPPAAT